ncbi:MAG: hypothetical protein B7X64_09790, partial [Halothiobacillus sp. 39-53-45]
MTSPTAPATLLAQSAAITPPHLSDGGLFTPNWAILATELAVVFFFFALIVGILALLARQRRIKAARFLLDERDRLAEGATETFNQHCLALRAEPLTEQELADYEQRSFDLVGELIAPWLTPTPDALRQATREIMTIRHNDLHQIAAMFRRPAAPVESTQTDTPEVAQLQHELTASLQAERERSAQLAEALKSVSIIVGEYGRKFGVDADFKVPQILRALLYLQATDAGLDSRAAKQSADEAMANGIIFIDDEDETAPSEAALQSTMPSTDQAPEVVAVSAQTAPPIQSTQNQSAPNQSAPMEPAPKPAPPQTKPAAGRLIDEAAHAQGNPSELAAAKLPLDETLDETLIDLDEIELPKPIEHTTDFNLDLDDIDALLDAEIARQQSAPQSNPLG